MNLLEAFREEVKRQDLFGWQDRLIVAASAGLDSTVLAELCYRSGCKISLAHCNFQLRGEESDRDQRFVERMAERYGAELHLKKFNTEHYALEEKLSVQEAARSLRYAWFAELAGMNEPPPFVLTAHHADDNVETLLMNFFRGTGLQGLTGIPAKAAHIRRPLLEFSKAELLAFAKESGLEYVEDSSNRSSKYSRNYFRNEVIPALAKIYPQVGEGLRHSISRFREIAALYEKAVTQLKQKLSRREGQEIHIPVKQLLDFGKGNRALVYEIVHEFGFGERQVEAVLRLCESGSGRHISSATHRIIRHRHWLIIAPLRPEESQYIVIEEEYKSVSFPGGTLRVEKVAVDGFTLDPNVAVAQLDAGLVRFPLLLRRSKRGDYFYPLGMRKKKKLARFFIDQKLSITEKENSWVLESEGRLLWVVGHRIDDRFRVTDRTREVLRLTFKRKELP